VDSSDLIQHAERQVADGDRDFLFGDARRPRNLALGLAVTIATFPLFWFVLLIFYALMLSGSPGADTRHGVRVLVVIAAVATSVGPLAVSADWLRARRRYAPDARPELLGQEGLLSGLAVVVALGTSVAFGGWVWETAL
jgi:hypothetical protein